jgi:hypothetical protein
MLFRRKLTNDATNLGAVLMSLGWCSGDQLKEAVATQADRLLGETLIAAGVLTGKQLEEALFKQAMLRGKASKRQILEHVTTQNASAQDRLVEGLKEFVSSAASISNTAKHAAVKRSK